MLCECICHSSDERSSPKRFILFPESACVMMCQCQSGPRARGAAAALACCCAWRRPGMPAGLIRFDGGPLHSHVAVAYSIMNVEPFAAIASEVWWGEGGFENRMAMERLSSQKDQMSKRKGRGEMLQIRKKARVYRMCRGNSGLWPFSSTSK